MRKEFSTKMRAQAFARCGGNGRFSIGAELALPGGDFGTNSGTGFGGGLRFCDGFLGILQHSPNTKEDWAKGDFVKSGFLILCAKGFLEKFLPKTSLASGQTTAELKLSLSMTICFLK